VSEKTLDQVAAIIAAALSERSLGRKAVPEDNPYVKHTVAQLAHGVTKFADNIPAISKAGASGFGQEMEAARIEGMRDGCQHRKAVTRHRSQRMRQRRAEFEALAAKPVAPKPERVTEAWVVVVHLLPIVERIATEKRQWAARFLGSITDDLAQLVVEKMVLVLAKSDWDLDAMAEAAEQLGDETRSTKRIPGDQLDDEARKHRRALRRARKLLMSVVNNWTATMLLDLYREAHNLRWENLDMLDTVMTSISSAGTDPYVANSKADRAPAMLGSVFPRPGEVNPDLLASAINAAITQRGLDRLTEVLLDENNRRTDGAVKWREVAEQVFRASPNGDQLWMIVERATSNLEMPSRAQGDAARRHVGSLFAWLPELIVGVMAAFDVQPIGWIDGHMVYATSYDMILEAVRGGATDPLGERRYPLRPALTYATAEEAAHALVASLEVVTGDDFVRSIQYA
jgi:hypothetical protein